MSTHREQPTKDSPQKGAASSLATTKTKPTRTRSPNYPAINLEAAIQKVRTLYNGPTRRHAIGVEVVASQWGNRTKSSTFKLALAAVRSFGLLSLEANGGHKLFKLTPLALDIVADYPEGSPEQVAAIKRAALLPKIHTQLWERWKADLPPDEEIRRYLIRERGFNDNTVGEFIDEYKETLSFANPTASDTIQSAGGLEDEGDDGNEDQDQGQLRQQRRRAMSKEMREDVFTLDEGPVVLQWPDRLSEASFQDFEDWMKLIIRKAKRSVLTEARNEDEGREADD